MNISEFMEWFITQFINIGTFILSKLDQIIIYGNVSLLQFIITLAIISAFISIIITAPSLGFVRREYAIEDRQARRDARREEKGK